MQVSGSDLLTQQSDASTPTHDAPSHELARTRIVQTGGNGVCLHNLAVWVLQQIRHRAVQDPRRACSKCCSMPRRVDARATSLYADLLPSTPGEGACRRKRDVKQSAAIAAVAQRTNLTPASPRKPENSPIALEPPPMHAITVSGRRPTRSSICASAQTCSWRDVALLQAIRTTTYESN